jgi:hypothetical protein
MARSLLLQHTSGSGEEDIQMVDHMPDLPWARLGVLSSRSKSQPEIPRGRVSHDQASSPQIQNGSGVDIESGQNTAHQFLKP